MTYTVQKLANIAGVTVRTLHHYDQIGLLKPAYIKENGYRYYGEEELTKLQQILFFRELEFPLEEIARIMQSPTYNREEALTYQRKLLALKKERLEGLLRTIDKTLKGGETMTTDDTFSAFDTKQMDEYKEEAKKRWGDTDAYKQSQARTKTWSKEKWAQVTSDAKAISEGLVRLMDRTVNDADVQALVARHYANINEFYDAPIEMYRSLGQMYVDDARFKASYDNVKPGLAVFLRDAIAYFCDTHK